MLRLCETRMGHVILLHATELFSCTHSNQIWGLKSNMTMNGQYEDEQRAQPVVNAPHYLPRADQRPRARSGRRGRDEGGARARWLYLTYAIQYLSRASRLSPSPSLKQRSLEESVNKRRRENCANGL